MGDHDFRDDLYDLWWRGRPRVVALIPARGGSVRIPRKNLATIGGVTLVERSIAAAKGSHSVREVFVSTDDDEIANVSAKAGATVHRRSPSLALSSTRMDDVVVDLMLAQNLHGDDLIILLEPTAPLRTSADIDVVVSLIRSTKAPAVRMVSVRPLNCHGYVYQDAGLATVIRAGTIGFCLFPPGTLLVHSGDDRAVDVDNMIDLERARALA